ncbi:MAG: biopolymer transporter ExbD [Deltaproteobacteria bacterium]|nr:biopolymer transporter ExbD [Deltaproteobacteria bacterium]
MAGAGASYQDEDGGVISDINVTPLVDITLVLLIIFMVTTPLIMSNPALKVDLPKAASGDETEKSILSLTLQRAPGGGTVLYLNSHRADEPRLRAVVPALLRENPKLEAILEADQGVPYGEVIHLVDLVKGLGVHRFALSTERSD